MKLVQVRDAYGYRYFGYSGTWLATIYCSLVANSLHPGMIAPVPGKFAIRLRELTYLHELRHAAIRCL
jgi:hypothetical protein